MRPLRRLSTLLACAAVTTLAWAAGASAATFTVTSQNDADDGICDGPHCSLREAINAANRTEAADLLRFSSDDPIVPATELPAIVSPLHITAFDTGRCDTDSAPLRLSGRGADFSGLVFAPGSDGSQICLVNVGGFRTGIELRSHGNAIRLSTIGTNPAGTSDAPNDVAGILVSGSGNLIGGERVRDRNVISGNGLYGVQVVEGTGNQIAGNLIGTDAQVLGNIPNGTGVQVEADATNTLVGSAAPGRANVISGNGVYGVDAAGGRIVGNHIGVDPEGVFPIRNQEAGVHAVGPVQVGGRTEAERNIISGHDVDVLVDGPATIQGNWIGPGADGRVLANPFSSLVERRAGIRLRPGAAGALIGGDEPGAGNVVGGQLIGIESIGAAGDFAIEGNLVGLAPDGTSSLDTEVGIMIREETRGARVGPDNTVGGDLHAISIDGEDTRLEGNTVGLDLDGEPRDALGGDRTARAGVVVHSSAENTTIGANAVSGLPTGIDLREDSAGTVIEGNVVGTDAEGDEPRPNLAGIVIGERAEARIGGRGAAQRNVISANQQAGVFSETLVADAVIEGNFIGLARDGETPLGNATGVELGRDDHAAPGAGDGFVVAGNRIAHNQGDGLAIMHTTAGVAAEENEIFANGDLGIDFFRDGVSPNGAEDAAVLPHFPLLTAVQGVTTGTSVQGTIDHPAGRQIRIELFSSPACDDSGHGQGRTPLGSLTLTAPGGSAAFSALVDAVPAGHGVVTATATDVGSGRTSEFSRCAIASAGPPPVADTPDEPTPGPGPGPGRPPPPTGPVVTDPGPIGLPPVIDPRPRCKVPKVVGVTLAKAKKRLKAELRARKDHPPEQARPQGRPPGRQAREPPAGRAPRSRDARPADARLRAQALALRYGRAEMPGRKIDRRREPGRTDPAPSLLRRSSNPVLALQRSIGNRAVAQMIAREPVRKGTAQVGGVGKIKVKGGNLEEWTGTGVFDTVDVTSEKGKHSAKLEKLSKERTRTDVTVMIDPANKSGEDLNVGGGTQLEIKGARITGYSVKDGVETWSVADFQKVARTKITRKIGAGE